MMSKVQLEQAIDMNTHALQKGGYRLTGLCTGRDFDLLHFLVESPVAAHFVTKYVTSVDFISSLLTCLPGGSTLHEGHVVVYVFDINQPSLPTPFLFCSCVCFCLYGPFNCISFLEFSR